MGTIIDELIVELKLDPKGFDEGQKKAVNNLRKFEVEHDKHAKRIASSTDKMTEGFSLLQGRLLAIAGLFMGGMGVSGFVDHMTKLTSQTGFFAKSLGLSTKELGAWQAAGATVGATANEIAQALGGYQKALANAKLGQPGFLSTMAYATSQNGAGPHLTPTRPDGSDKSPTEYLLDAADWHTKFSARRSPAESTVLMERNGMPQGMINLLSLGRTELQKRLKEGEKFAPSADDVKKFQDLQVEMGKASMAAEKLGRSIALLLTPGLIKFMESLNHVVDAFVKGGWIEGLKAANDEASSGTGEGFKSLGVDASSIGEKANQGWWGRFKSKFEWHNPFARRPDPITNSGDGPGGAAGAGASAQSVLAQSGMTPRAASSSAPRPEDPLPRNAHSRAAVAKGYFADQLRREGVPEANVNAAASLLAGQAIAESNLNPNLSHDGGTGYGIYGARLGRRSRMFAWLQKNGYARNSLEGQARYMAYEAMNDPTYRPSRNALMAATPDNMAFATRVLTGNFERPAVDNSAHRHRAAQGVLALQMSQRQPTAASGAFDAPWNNRMIPFANLPSLSSLGARAALNNSISTINNTSHSNQTTIGSMSVTVPPGADPAGYASGIQQELQRYSPIMNANTGLK